jgi:hypothetical protein
MKFVLANKNNINMTLTANDFETINDVGTEVKTAEEMGIQTPIETNEVKTEFVAETKNENVTTENVVTEEKKEVATEAEAEVKTSSLFDKFTKPTSETIVEDSLPKEDDKYEYLDYDELVADYESKLEKYNSPLAKLLGGDYDLTNVDLKEFLSKAIGENFESMSDEQLIERSLNQNPHFSKLSPEDQEEEIESMKANFEVMSKLQKLTEREKLIGTLGAGSTNDILASLEEIQKGQQNMVNPEEFFETKSKERFEETYGAVKNTISELSKSLIGQEYNGYKVSEEDAKAIEAAFDEQTLSFDAEKVAFNLFKASTYDKAVESAYKRGLEEGVKEKTNPSKGSVSSAPIFKGEKKGMEGMSASDWANVQL